MSEFNKSEIRMMNQILLGLFIAVNYAYFLSLGNTPFPWFSYLGAPVGLAIILFCWIGKKYLLFNIALLAATVIYSIAFNWGALFPSH
ncbi:hypothetical protein D0469_08625 [Peribacillus saganii]|uniref:Uncharacterized protein n=1 Tax=Peribacillus saganii TaxID=2303992 RepID=A0A372LQA5_9BACI|nr:hypothetical protein [Peribacillus saganii]RFU69862.1 hypothetical protein D0469_08625 [Peribacillus saganii]